MEVFFLTDWRSCSQLNCCLSVYYQIAPASARNILKKATVWKFQTHMKTLYYSISIIPDGW